MKVYLLSLALLAALGAVAGIGVSLTLDPPLSYYVGLAVGLGIGLTCGGFTKRAARFILGDR